MCSSMFTFYAIELLYQNMRMVFEDYFMYAAAYVSIVTLSSISFVYWYEPSLNKPRTVNLTRWFLQGVALFIIYLSIQVSVRL